MVITFLVLFLSLHLLITSRSAQVSASRTLGDNDYSSTVTNNYIRNIKEGAIKDDDKFDDSSRRRLIAATTADASPLDFHSSSSNSNAPIPLFYIHIDRENKESNQLPAHVNALLTEVDSQLQQQQQVQVQVFTYSQLLPLVSQYDARLGEYFSLLNPYYESMFVNIGRAVLLYRFGGIYHDIKERSSSSAAALNYILAACHNNGNISSGNNSSDVIMGSSSNYSLILQVRPDRQQQQQKKQQQYVQVSNMVACSSGSSILAAYLAAVKVELRRIIVAHDNSPYNFMGSQILFDIMKNFATCKLVETEAATATAEVATTRALSASGRKGMKQQQPLQLLQQQQQERRKASECKFGGERCLNINFNMLQHAAEVSIQLVSNAPQLQFTNQPLMLLPQNGTTTPTTTD